MEHEKYRQWLDLEVDGSLEPAESGRLAAHLEACAACRDERDRLVALAERMRSARIAVRPGFSAEVMAALGSAPWEARPAHPWRVPVALAAALAAVAALAWNLAGASSAASGGAWAALAALGDLVRTGLLAASGLALATWAGVGSAVAEWLGASPLRWLAAVGAVVGFNYVALRLIRSRSAVRVPERGRRR
ncbi:MAG TPA: zf-HC2 domain-containing protein [Thermoanaerobaculia bacterium]|nr:zf-HC2 domain-containing protein [Thermoanaerobaculia bacterium]